MAEAATRPIWIIVAYDPPRPDGTALRRDRMLSWALRTFLAKGYRHCFVIREMHTADGWLLIDPKSTCLDALELIGDSYVKHIAELCRVGEAHAVAVRPMRPDHWEPRTLFTCVSVAAHLLGLRVPFWATPKRLITEATKHLEVVDMGSLFGGPDTSAADAAAKEAREDRQRLEKENKGRKANINSRQSGRNQFAFLAPTEDGFGSNV